MDKQPDKRSARPTPKDTGANEGPRRGSKPKPPRLDPRIQALAEQVQSAMDMADISGLQLAKRSGVDQSHLSKWLRGEVGLSMEQVLNASPLPTGRMASRPACTAPRALIGRGVLSSLVWGAS